MSDLWQPETFREMFAATKVHNVLVCSLVHGTVANTRIEKTRSRKTYNDPRIPKTKSGLYVLNETKSSK